MEGFRYMFSKILPNFNMPSRYIITKCCKDLYFEQVIILKKIINDADVVYLTTDGWTKDKRSYITTTIQLINSSWEMENFVLQTREMDVYIIKYIYIYMYLIIIKYI